MNDSLGFPRRLRLRRRRDFQAMYAEGRRQGAGPLLVLARPNDLGHPRLGLAVPRRVGTAVRRTRIKRLLREAFRHLQHELPSGYDVVVQVRPHEPLAEAAYRTLLTRALRRLDRQWTNERPSPDDPAP
ncbi:MAG: ribonuclease P protein component [Planctomycetota bacterium]|jgi:ribonuclease P protein component